MAPGLAASKAVPDGEETEAACVLNESEEETKRIFDEARQEGFKQGMADAEARIHREVEMAEQALIKKHEQRGLKLEETLGRMDKLLSSMQDTLAQRESLLDAEVADLAYAAVCRLLGTWQADGRLIVKLCEAVVAEYRHRPAILRVNTNDLPLVADLRRQELRIEGDPALPPGCCRMEGPAGDYETSMEFRLQSLKEALKAGGEAAS
ncbi:hypothetical protein EBB59_02550 [Lysobacter pythonis]|uniref:Flagellar assembly protein FliH n=1 Tax=Solilutibacter pythonis TaxID=2483112 RepID=A0A3M2I4B0_9GAMM|nr:hypothetical protein EBB59_02550 [Lysobacter pythonis]